MVPPKGCVIIVTKRTEYITILEIKNLAVKIIKKQDKSTKKQKEEIFGQHKGGVEKT